MQEMQTDISAKVQREKVATQIESGPPAFHPPFGGPMDSNARARDRDERARRKETPGRAIHRSVVDAVASW